jgi:hypothetical protein
MSRQFRLAYVRPSADGKMVTATIIDHDFDRFTNLTADVKLLGDDHDGNPIVRFPARKLVAGNVLDLDR